MGYFLEALLVVIIIFLLGETLFILMSFIFQKDNGNSYDLGIGCINFLCKATICTLCLSPAPRL